ncbi:hypothetical protein, partial [Shewanella surugensis]
MPTAIELNGSWFNRSISTSDIQDIKTAKSIDDVNSTWGKIADWFCGTNKEEAKQNLFIFMSRSESPENKIEAFNTLKSLVSPSFSEQNFIETYTGNIKEIKIQTIDLEEIFSFKIDILSYNDCTKVTERINKIDNKAITGQFLKDTNRADYFL